MFSKLPECNMSMLSPPVQESKMMAPGGQSDGFVNLKREKNNIKPSEVKDSVQPSAETVAQPKENYSASSTSLLLLPCEQKWVHVRLPPPSAFGSAEKFPVAEKEAPLQQKQLSKTFTEGPPLDCAFSLKWDESLPATKCSQGEIKYATKGALKQMIEYLSGLNHANTGCVIDETCVPESNYYIEGKHFVSEKDIWRGSFGKVDLCYDLKTRKQFIRKQLPKAILRTSEVIVLMTLNHINITKFHGLIQREIKEEGNATMELLIEHAGVALNNYMLDGNCLTHKQIWDLSKQGLEALAHLNDYSIVHLNIKPKKFLVSMMISGSLLLKLTGFGSSKLPGEPLKSLGKPEYMATEVYKIVLQTKGFGLDWGLTEADITGKVDTFAFGLVIMYMYLGYHILIKVINNGKKTYEGLDMQTRQQLRLSFMIFMADDNTGNGFVQKLIPEECDLNMRALLCGLLEYKHQDRFSARQGLKSIKGIAEDCMENDNGPVKNSTKDAIILKLQPYGKSGKKDKNMKEQKEKLLAKQEQTVGDVVDQRYIINVPVTVFGSGGQKEIQEGSMKNHIGPVKKSTIDAIRQRIQPYGKSGKKEKKSKDLSSSKGICMQALTQEMNELRQGSMTERRAAIAKPSVETSVYPSQVSQPVEPALGFNIVNPSQPVKSVPGSSKTNPYSSLLQPEDNVVSLGGKLKQQTDNVHPTGLGKVLLFEIPQELIQRWLEKKYRAQQEMVKAEPNKHP